MTYGCHNKQRPGPNSGYWAQDGLSTVALPTSTQGGGEAVRTTRWKWTPHRLTTDCQYTLTTDDVGCNGCRWQRRAVGEGDGMAPPACNPATVEAPTTDPTQTPPRPPPSAPKP